MTTPEPQAALPRVRFDPLALPIAAKIGIALAIVLIITGLITNSVIRRVVSDAQTNVSRAELVSYSRTQSLRLIDSLGQETISLTRLGTDPIIQQGLADELAADAAAGAGETTDHFAHYLQDTQLAQELISFHRTTGEFDAVALLDTNGHLLAIDPALTQPETINTANWDWYDTTIAGGAGKVGAQPVLAETALPAPRLDAAGRDRLHDAGAESESRAADSRGHRTSALRGHGGPRRQARRHRRGQADGRWRKAVRARHDDLPGVPAMKGFTGRRENRSLDGPLRRF